MTLAEAGERLVTIAGGMGAPIEVLGAYDQYQARRGLMPTTIYCRRLALQRAADWLAPVPLLDATPAQLEAWLDSMSLASRSRSWKVSTLSCFYEFAIRAELTTMNPTRRIDRPRGRRYLPRPIAHDDLALAFRHADPLMMAWLGLAALQGLRCAEIAQLRGEDVERGGPDPVLVVVHGKGDRSRVLPLNRQVESALLVLGLPSSGPVFRRDDGGPHTPCRVSQILNGYLHGLGIKATAHQLRHSFGTRLYAQTRDLRLCQELMGHQSAKPPKWSGTSAWRSLPPVWRVGVGLVVALAVGCGGGGKSAAPTTTAQTSFEITGELQVPPWNLPGDFSNISDIKLPPTLKDGDVCQPDDGYDDLGAGGQVKIKNEDGKLIGSTSLQTGHIARDEVDGVRVVRCVFDIARVTVPKASFYQIEAGHRSPVSYSFADMEAKDWRIELSIGA